MSDNLLDLTGGGKFLENWVGKPGAPAGQWGQSGNVYVRHDANGDTFYYPRTQADNGQLLEFGSRADAEKANGMQGKQLQDFVAKNGTDATPQQWQQQAQGNGALMSQSQMTNDSQSLLGMAPPQLTMPDQTTPTQKASYEFGRKPKKRQKDILGNV